VDLPDDLPAADRKRIDETDYAEYRAKVRLEAQQALNAAIDAHLEPQLAYIGKPHGSEDGNDLGIENRTRLGDEGITVIPLQVIGEYWRIRDGDTPFDPRQPISDTLARALYARQMKISRKAIVALLGPEPVPPAFEAHPLLRDMRPLLLVDGCAVLGNQVVRLDAVLGLVLETAEPASPPVSDKEE
jgi:CRISPR-associated endonuclease/helicase Cas3